MFYMSYVATIHNQVHNILTMANSMHKKRRNPCMHEERIHSSPCKKRGSMHLIINEEVITTHGESMSPCQKKTYMSNLK